MANAMDQQKSIFDVRYWFDCPKSNCLKLSINMATIAADDSANAGQLAVAGLTCEHCQKELPKGHFVHTAIRDLL